VLFFADNSYVYAGNNPLSNVDPSGQRIVGASASQAKAAAKSQARSRVQSRPGAPKKASGSSNLSQVRSEIWRLCSPFGNNACQFLWSQLSRAPASQVGDWMRRLGVGLVIVGILVLVLDAIYVFKTDPNKVEAMELATISIDLILQAVGAISAWPGVKESIVYAIVAFGNGVVSAINGVLALVHAIGIFAQDAVDVTVDAVTVAATGEVAPVEAIADTLLSGFVSYLLQGAASGLIAAGNGLIALGYKWQGE